MNILLLAGTHEARVLAQIIDNIPEYFLISSLAGVTKEPVKISRNMRFGGFGGVEGLKKFIRESNIEVVIDVTHPFARIISKNAKSACSKLNIPYFLFERPEWVKLASDNWIEINDENELKSHLSDGDTIFVASGRESAKHFKACQNIKLICRQIDDPGHAFPYANGIYLIGRPPFSVESEIKLFQQLGVDWLLVKNSGGSQSEAKLIAARALGIKVAMIKRPYRMERQIYTNTKEVINCLEELLNA